MDIKQLKYFTAVAEEGTISAAAKRLYVSQPPLSTQMQQLEKELGCKLFERGQKKIRLTEAGKLLYERASLILDMEEVAVQDVKACSKAENVTVRIGIVSSVVCSGAADRIADFLAQNPGIRFEIFESDTYTLLEKLHAGVIHLAIIRTPFSDDGVTFHSISEEKMTAVGAADVLGRAVTMKELSQLPLILYRRWQSIISNEFASAGLDMNCVCICDDARTAVKLAEKRAGTALVPSSASSLITSGNTVCSEISDCTIRSEIVLAYKDNSYLPEGVKSFIDYMMK
mgnify:FL=1